MICAGCPHLDKEKHKDYSGCWLYGCDADPSGYVHTWINDDSLLEKIGCEREENKQLSVFDFLEE